MNYLYDKRFFDKRILANTVNKIITFTVKTLFLIFKGEYMSSLRSSYWNLKGEGLIGNLHKDVTKIMFFSLLFQNKNEVLNNVQTIKQL